MTKKFKLLFVFMLCSFILTACGARVHTETSFHKDGSGNRIVYINIAMKDEGKIEGGFEKLESVLREKAPSCIEVKRYENADEKTMIYELKYEFTDIEDFRAKTEEVIGEKSNIEWKEKEGVFKQNFSYSEDTSTDQLIQWVKDAISEESISGTIIGQIYEEENNTIHYEGKQVWSGKGNASFIVDKTPTLEEVSVYSSYSDKGKETKQVKLGFSYDDYLDMDTEEGLEYLHQFSKKFKVDSTCNGYSVTLTGTKELEQFFEKASDELSGEVPYADLEVQKTNKKYYFENKNENSIFSNQFSVKEVYNFNNLLAGFKLSTNRIKDYVSIPKRNSYSSEQVHHTYALESNKAYQYIGEYDIGDTYYMYFAGGQCAQLDKANVSFFIDENLLGTQTVVLKITKNGMNLTNSDVMKYYSTLGEKVQYEEEGSKVKITFLKEFQCDKEESELKRIKSLSLHKLKYELNTSFTLNSYFPVDTEKVTYTVSLPNSLKVEHFSFGNEVLNKKEIKAGKDKQQWTYQVQLEGAQEVTINLDFAKPNFIFYGIMSIVVLLLIGGGLSVYFYFIRDSVTRRKRPIG